MHRIFTPVFLILALSVFVGDAHSVSHPILPKSFAIRYQGSPAIAKFIDIANKVYGKSTFTSNVLTKSKGGEECVFNGSCDIGGVADELKPAFRKRGKGCSDRKGCRRGHHTSG